MRNPGFEHQRFATKIDVAPLEVALNENAPARACDDYKDFFERNLHIGETLPAAGLEHVVPFNSVYSRMTHRVMDYLDRTEDEKAEGEKFQKPEWVKKNMPSFGEKYHDDLRLYVAYAKTGDPTFTQKMNPAWAHVFLSPEMKSNRTPKALRVLAGVNAHIESEDLAASMAEVDTPDDYYPDFLLIDQAISEVIEEHLPEYLPMNGSAARFSAKNLCRWIVHMRADAWKNSREIRAKLHQGEDVQEIKDNMNKRTVRHNRAILLGAPAVNLAMNQWARVAPNRHGSIAPN